MNTNCQHLLIAMLMTAGSAYVANEAVQPHGVRIELEFDDTPIYQGMTAECIVRLEIEPNNDVQAYTPVEELSIEGCQVDYSPNVPEKPEGGVYEDGTEHFSVVIDRIYITPEKNGCYVIPSMAYDVDAIEAVVVNHPYWGSQIEYNPAKLELRTEPKYLLVKPLPANPPQGYNGVLGSFSSSVRCSAKEATTDKLLTLSIAITGVGNLSDIELPPLQPSSFSLPCTVSEPFRTCREQKAGNLMMGVVRYTYTIKPLQTGRLDIDLPSLVYFNTETEEYASLLGNSLNLNIKASNDE